MPRLTFRYRVRDRHSAELGRMARAVNLAWNWCNETQRTAVQRGNRWPSHFDLCKLSAGGHAEIGLPAHVVLVVCKTYAQSRSVSKRRVLRFRGRNSLGWVPLQGRDIKIDAAGVRVHTRPFGVWLSRPVPAGGRVLDGTSFAQDARGRWYLNVVVEVPDRPISNKGGAVGIDLGLKSLVTLSTGESIATPRWERRAALKMAMAQRARKRRLMSTLHAKIVNQRRDHLHNVSAQIARSYRDVCVGNVSAYRLGRTSMARSVFDAGWSSLRRMLQYKSDYAGGTYREVDEKWTTQVCSECGSLGGPEGRKGLRVRGWTCGGCGAVHDRDVNAARNILRWAHPTPQGADARAPEVRKKAGADTARAALDPSSTGTS